MRHFTIGGAMFVSALALAGCGQTEQKAAPADNATNAAAPAPAGNTATEEGEAPSAQAGAQQDFSIVNNTGHVVVTLNVSPSNSDEWGPDILGRDVLADGESAQITFPRGEDQCQWDLRATFDDGDTGDWRGVNLCEVATVTLTPS